MAYLDKRKDREDWLHWAIEFARRGLWADTLITVHGPHDPTNAMWGDAEARTHGGEANESFECDFVAVANGSKYRPVRVRIWNHEDHEERFPLVKPSQLTPQARRWLRVARRTLKKLSAERIECGRELRRRALAAGLPIPAGTQGPFS